MFEYNPLAPDPFGNADESFFKSAKPTSLLKIPQLLSRAWKKYQYFKEEEGQLSKETSFELRLANFFS